MINYSYQVPIRDSSGAKLSGALVELKKGATTVTLVELGTSGVYRTNAIVQGQWRVWVNGVDSGDDVEVGGGRLEDAGYAIDSIFICDTSTTIALITPTDYKAKLGLDNVSNIAIPTTLTASYYLAVNSAGTAYELIPTPTIPTATLANVASDSITQADNTYQLKSGIDFLIQDSGGSDLFRVNESAGQIIGSTATMGLLDSSGNYARFLNSGASSVQLSRGGTSSNLYLGSTSAYVEGSLGSNNNYKLSTSTASAEVSAYIDATHGFKINSITSATSMFLYGGADTISFYTNSTSSIPNGLAINGILYPTTDGTAGQVMTTDGSGSLSFTTISSGGIGGSGTTNYLPKFTASTTLGDSIISDDGTTATVTGAFSATGNVTLGDSSVDTVDVSGSLNVVTQIKSNGSIIIDDLGTASTTGLYFKDDGVNRWITAFRDTRDYAIYRYDSSGVFQDRPIVIDNITGDVDFANNITATEINGVALTTGGSATQYLDGTGNYSTPACSGGGGARTATVTWSNPGTFTSSDKYMNCMQGTNSSGSSEYPSGNSSGLSNQNGAFPFVVPFNCTVKECYIAVKGVAQSTKTPASTVTINFELQTLDADFDGFTKVSDLDFPIDSSNYTIGTYGTSSIDTNYKGVNNLGQNLNAGDVIAVLFDSQNGASVCNNFQGGFITMILEER